MSNKKSSSLVSTLRFPEFREAGEWVEKMLGEIAEFAKGKGLPKNELNPNGINQCIHYGELFTDYAEVINIIKNRTNLESSVVLSKENDVLMPTSDVTPNGLAKACCINLSGIVLGGDILIIRTNAKNISGEFLARYIRHLERKVLQLVTGTTVYHLYASSIEKLTLQFPTLPEQQKIAACLSSLDELITAHSQKLNALKKHKKGLMQQLFPAEGETVPTLRFPEFREAGEWEESELDALINLLSGYAFQSDYFSEDGHKLLTPKNFTKSGYANFNNGNTKFTTEDFDPKYVCKEGDLLLLLTDLTSSCELLGKPILLRKEDGEVLLNQRIVRVTTKGNICIHFMLYFFLTDSYHKRIKKTATGSTVRHSSNKIISSTKIRFPSLKEQQKIAACLSSLDELITAQGQKLDALKKHKKGLMQQLFPAVGEE